MVAWSRPAIRYSSTYGYNCSGIAGTFSADSLAGFTEYQSTYRGSIDSIIITKQQPESLVQYWPPFHNDVENTNSVAHIYASYAFDFDPKRPPTAADCLTGDELLDQQSVRDWLHLLWADSTNALGPKSLRREVPFGIFEDSVTGDLKFLRSVPAAFETPCRGNPAGWDGPTPGPNIAIGHNHPMGTHLDTLAANCFQDGKLRLWDDTTHRGISAPDWYTLSTAPAPIPMYVVDSLHVHIVAPDATPNTSSSKVRVLRRDNALNLCTIL